MSRFLLLQKILLLGILILLVNVYGIFNTGYKTQISDVNSINKNLIQIEAK